VSNRTVVAVEPRGDDTVAVKLSKAPGAFADARVPKLFDCSPEQMPPWNQADAVQQHGRTIYDKLGTHDAIKEAIAEMERIQAPNVRSLYFHLVAEVAERLSWETLCDPKGTFFALDRRWPIARMADSAVDQGLPRGDFVAPLKVMAVLSALHKPAQPEWISLRDAAIKARKNGLDVDLLVMVGEEGLLADIRQEAADGGLAWVTAQPVPARVADLDEALTEFQPHILHFYGHGSTSAGVPQLQLAIITDWDDDAKTTGSLIVKLEELVGFPALADVWLVTLNCCVGAKAANDLHSMAHRIVAGGVPAAVGMTEPIDATDAHEFASVFYPTLFAHLHEALNAAKAAGKAVEFEWAPALHPARTALRDLHGEPTAHRIWTLPVLYVRPEPFEIRFVKQDGGPPAPGAPPPPLSVVDDPIVKARINAVAGALRALPPDTPAAARVELLALLNDVPEPFRPALDGTFKTSAAAGIGGGG
jgi:CHAT domain-containing protein